MMMAFQRTKCACPQCRACCKTMPGNLVPGDLEAITAACRVDVEEEAAFLRERFVASEGALVGTRSGALARIPTIVPAQRADGSCVFFTSEERCAVHAVAPFGCRMFTPHMSREESDPIVAWGLRRIIEDAVAALRGLEGQVDAAHRCKVGLYSKTWDMLAASGLRAASLEVRKQRLKQALDALEKKERK